MVARRREAVEIVAEEVVVVVSRPRRTLSLNRSTVRKRPVEGSARTMRSLKELVPISTAANRFSLVAFLAGIEVVLGGIGRLADIYSVDVLLFRAKKLRLPLLSLTTLIKKTKR